MKRDFCKVMICAACVVGMGAYDSDASHARMLIKGAQHHEAIQLKKRELEAQRQGDQTPVVTVVASDGLKAGDFGKNGAEMVRDFTRASQSALAALRDYGTPGFNWDASVPELQGATARLQNIHAAFIGGVAGAGYAANLSNVPEVDAAFLGKAVALVCYEDAKKLMSNVAGTGNFADLIHDDGHNAERAHIRAYYTALDVVQTAVNGAFDKGKVKEVADKYKVNRAKKAGGAALSQEEKDFMAKIDKISAELYAEFLK